MTDGSGRRRTAVHIEHVAILPLGVEPGRKDAAVVPNLLSRQHHGAGAVAEQHTGRAVFPVEDTTEGLAADHPPVVHRAGPPHRTGTRKGIAATTTPRHTVQGATPGGTAQP